MTSGIIRAFQFIRFQAVHRRSRSVIKRWQDRHLRTIVAHAFENVPVYRELYTSAGVAPGDIQTTEDIGMLPITRKQTFIGRPFDEYIDNSQPVRQVWETTSGTSGVPFRFMLGRNALEERYLNSICFRFITWLQPWRMDFARMKVARIKIRSHTSDFRMFIPVADFLANPEEAVNKLAAFEPYVLESYTSMLLLLANTLEHNPELPRLKPSFVVSFGEVLTDAARAYLRQTFGCDVYDRYGIEEMSVVASECARHDGQHVHSESIIAEIVDESGNPLPYGSYGRVILTDLTNVYMPFIRYDTGDHGRLSWEPCACGLQTPRLWFEGRYAAFVTLGGKKIHHLEFDAALDTFMNVIRQYQVAKVSESHIEIRITTGDQYASQDEERILTAIRPLVGDGISLSVVGMDEIPVTPRGKCKILVDES